MGTNVIGTRGGEENHTLNTAEMTQHNHALNADTTTPTASNTFTPGAAGSSVLGNAAGTITPTGSFTVTLYNPASPNATLSPGVISNTGGSQAHTNIQPYLTLNLCIALQGIFPSQN